MQDLSTNESVIRVEMNKKINEFQQANDAETSSEELKKIYLEYVDLRKQLDVLKWTKELNS